MVRYAMSERRACRLLKLARSTKRYRSRRSERDQALKQQLRAWAASGRGRAEPMRRNQRWSMDFVSDSMATGQTVRVLTVVDDYTRECLAMETDTSLSGWRVRRVLDRITGERGRP